MRSTGAADHAGIEIRVSWRRTGYRQPYPIELNTLLNPFRWTLFTWLALLLWLSIAAWLNFPPPLAITTYTRTGPVESSKRYATLKEYPNPIGWPFRYIRPDPRPLLSTPAFSGSDATSEASNLSLLAVVANAILILIVLTSLGTMTQIKCPRFSMRLLLLLPPLVCFLILCSRYIALELGTDAYWYFGTAIYFLPVLFVLPDLFGFRLISSYFHLSRGNFRDGG